MASIALFDDLPDLTVIELFCYLSSLDILWAFTCLNSRLTALIAERGFFRHVNLSSSSRRQFDTVLRVLPLNDIESLTIDINASPLQLTRWPHLPRLTRLRLRGLREPDHALFFVLLHEATLTHLKIESDEIFVARGYVVDVQFPRSEINPLVNNILHRLPALRSLDLGMKYHTIAWCITDIPMHLTYLRVALQRMNDLLNVMCTRSLSETLRQLHVTVVEDDARDAAAFAIDASRLLPQMTQLHTFTFLQTGPLWIISAWPYAEIFTASSVMPILRKAYLMIHMTINDLDCIGQSALFVDDRRVDVHFALIVKGDQQHLELAVRVPRGSFFHPRQIVSATFIVSYWVNYQRYSYTSTPHPYAPQARQHVWYTLPWSFTEVLELTVPDRCITELGITQMQTFMELPVTTTIGPSRLLTLNASNDVLSAPIHLLPYIVSFDHINTFHLSFCETLLSVRLPALRHVTLINSPSSLENLSWFPLSVCSIQIQLRFQVQNFVRPNWFGLRFLSALPMLNSLRLVLFDVITMMDDASCQIIAETAPMVTDFGFCFRRLYRGLIDYDVESAFNSHATFIEQLNRRILALPSDKQPYSVVEYHGCGLTVWF